MSEQADADADPIARFGQWRDEATEAVGAMAADSVMVATATLTGRPSARAVILRTVDARGFVFYTDEASRKARELAANPWAALVFLWPERQVRVEGEVHGVPDDEADATFRERPRDHQLATWACRQDEPLADRTALERGMEAAMRQFDGVDDVPRPPYWVGYRLVPDAMEFWEARASRLHHRVQYRREVDEWVSRLLSP